MQAVIDSLVGVVTGVFTLGGADLITIGINMIMGLSMFLPMTVGQLSFGQAGFMSIGAHIAVVLTLYAGVSFPIALLVAGLGSGVVGFLVGVALARLAPGARDLCLCPGGRGLLPQFQAYGRRRRYPGHLSLHQSVVRVRLPGAPRAVSGAPAPVTDGPGL